MRQKDLKKAIHRHNSTIRKAKLRQHYKESLKDLSKGKYRNHNYGPGIDLVLKKNELANPVTVHNYRQTILNMLTSSKQSPSKTRSSLNEFVLIQFSGVIADVIKEPNKKAKILIDHPFIEKGIFTGQTYLQKIGRPLDSHIWIQAENIIMKADNYYGDPTITVGDTIRLVGTIESYYGKVHGIKTTRYGINHCMIMSCGIPVLMPNTKQRHVKIQSLFNRHNDWSIKFKNLKEQSQLQQHLPNNIEFTNRYIYKPSKWMHYSDRMGLNKKYQR